MAHTIDDETAKKRELEMKNGRPVHADDEDSDDAKHETEDDEE